MERRTLVRSLLGLAFGVPVVVEGGTLLGLFGSQLAGAKDDGGTATETTGVGVGDELLEATAVAETITDAAVTIREGYWQFDLAIEVENTTDANYRLVLGDVETTGGKQVAGTFRTEVPPGDSKTLNGTWRLPESERPASIHVEAYRDSDPVAGKTVKFEGVAARS